MGPDLISDQCCTRDINCILAGHQQRIPALFSPKRLSDGLEVRRTLEQRSSCGDIGCDNVVWRVKRQ